MIKTRIERALKTSLFLFIILVIIGIISIAIFTVVTFYLLMIIGHLH